jgi:hypothetical protein
VVNTHSMFCQDSLRTLHCQLQNNSSTNPLYKHSPIYIKH